MSVHYVTAEHFRVAERNRDIARVLISPTLAGLRPTPWEWVAVVAFYAAVHYVNGYLWETARFVPKNHGQRSGRVRRDRGLRRASAEYGRLSTVGYQARYDPAFALSETDARDLVETDLRAVEATVMAALNLPTPTW